MKQALGLVEISGLSTTVVVADTMVKAANIRILEVENTKGLGYMTIKVEGDVGAVKAAVDAGCQVGRMNGRLVSWKVIPRPSDSVESTFCRYVAVKPSVPPQPPEPEKPETEPVEIKEEVEAETSVEPENTEQPVTSDISHPVETSAQEVKKTIGKTRSEKRNK